jgi:hypothetical protein
MSEEEKPKVDPQELEKLAAEDPKSKKWNNANSRKNLRQYKEPIDPELVSQQEGDEAEAQTQADEITRGRKLSPELVKRLIPKRGILTGIEKTRYNGIVNTFLSDFRNEEPTATDVDDILEIALCDVMEMRLLDACRNDPGSLVAASQALERFHKRKQTAKENLANRRSDRKDTRSSQEVNIVDIVVRYDAHRQQAEKERMDALLREEDVMGKTLKQIIEEDPF